MFKIYRAFQYLGFVGLCLICLQMTYPALNLNLAHWALLHWTPTLPYEEGKHLLAYAISFGEKAGSQWFEYGHGERARALLAQMQSDLWHRRFKHQSAFETGQRLEAQGQIEAALVAYQDAANQVELRVPSIYAIYRLTQTFNPIMAEECLYRLTTLEPSVRVDQVLDDRYHLLGVDLDDWSIAWDGAHIAITLYWQLTTDADVPHQWNVGEWQYIRIQDRLYQIGVVSNLLPNGGFEQDLSTIAVLPTGYQNIRDYRLRETSEIGDFLHQYHNLSQEHRNSYLSQVAVMTGIPDQFNGFSAPRVPVDDSALYLLSGWMHTTDEGEGYLGGVWEKDKIEIRYWKIAEWSVQTSWRQYIAVELVPTEASEFRFLALQRGAGAAVFDSVLFCEIPLLKF